MRVVVGNPGDPENANACVTTGGDRPTGLVWEDHPVVLECGEGEGRENQGGVALSIPEARTLRDVLDQAIRDVEFMAYRKAA